ncbi:FkbM family methyltransferase [Calothrix membranacea FACHB-236]|nr:FkbM family methyltransferase [Calothrix membranacea FACHB-236]
MISNQQHWRYNLRVLAGATLHNLGAYRSLLPRWCPQPTKLQQRLRDYLAHYYREIEQAEVILKLPELGGKFCCDLRDHMLEPYVWGEKIIYEFKEIEYCRKQVKPRDYIVDIGANHGFWGITLGRAINASAVYLLEANPKILQRLEKTTQINQELPIQILPYAITDGQITEVDFYLPVDNLSGLGSTVLHSQAYEHGYLKDNQKITVAARSLDQLWHDGYLKNMDIVKIDVEQAEDAVIRGGLKVLQECKPRLLMVETSNESWAFQQLNQLGYQAYCLDDLGNEIAVTSEYFWGNIFFRIS